MGLDVFEGLAEDKFAIGGVEAGVIIHGFCEEDFAIPNPDELVFFFDEEAVGNFVLWGFA